MSWSSVGGVLGEKSKESTGRLASEVGPNASGGAEIVSLLEGVVISFGQVISVGVVLLRGRASRRVESAEDRGLSHEARSVGSTKKIGSFSSSRAPRTLRTTVEARTCKLEGWSADRERLRVV